MISDSKFYGGAEHTILTATTSLHLGSKRFQCFRNTSGATRIVNLPDVNTAVRSNQTGFWLVLYLESASTSSVQFRYLRNGVTQTLGTLTAGQVAWVWLTVAGTGATYRWQTRTVNTQRLIRQGAKSLGNFSTPDEPSYDPFCFIGSDCELADPVPLNGQDGNPTVLAPMFQDVPAFAKNQFREAIRAADVVMPSTIILRLTKDCFVVDTDHPYTKTLSDEFFDALFQDGNPHVISYAGSAHGLSRNPMHMNYAGTMPTLNWAWDTNQQVKRHYWNKIIPYTVESTGVSYQIEIRFVLEHVVSPEPVFNRCGGGGANDHDKGGWGSFFMVYIFATEIRPEWVEGGTFQPAGSADAGLTFTYNDPFVNGAWHGVDPISKKFCHPQMAMMAILPTTFHSPVGKLWVPLEERPTYHAVSDDPSGPGTGVALNRDKAYLVDNGSPWTTQFPYKGGTGTAYLNVTFGKSTSTVNSQAMTLGGDLPRSKPMEWLCWENQRSNGQTFFAPSKPGWDENLGVLDLSNGNCGSIVIPIDCNEVDSPNPSDNNKWHLDPHPCTGHPDEPFMDIGGSHKCFRNYDGPGGDGVNTKCCINLGIQVAYAIEACTRETSTFDDECIQIGILACSLIDAYRTQRVMYLSDYSYVADGNQSLRIASWERVLPDPNQTLYDFVYAGSADPDMVDKLGTWTSGATITNATVAGSGSVRACLSYEPAAWTNNRDCIIAARARKIRQKSHGLLVKGSKPASDVYGYGLNVVPVTPGAGTTNLTCQLVKYNASGKTVLASTTILNVSTDDCDLELIVQGTDLTAHITPSGGSEVELTAWDGEFSTGFPGLITEATSTGNIEFDTWSITDSSTDFIKIEASVGPNLITIDFPAELMFGYGKCNGSGGPAGCGTAPVCSCSSWTETIHRKITTNGPGTGLDFRPRSFDGTGACVSGDNPTSGFGEIQTCCGYVTCVDGDSGCVECPPQFPALSFLTPYRCSLKRSSMPAACNQWVSQEPSYCKGITDYYHTFIDCS